MSIKMRNITKKEKDKYQNTPEPFYLDIHFLHLQTITSAIPSNGIIACFDGVLILSVRAEIHQAL